MSDDAAAKFAEALAAFQAELPHVAKGQTANTGTYSYDYADLTDITAVAVPLLSSHGLSWTAAPTLTERGFVLRYALIHSAGHRETGDYPLPDPAKCSPQQIGSALTYARRYALCAVTGIAPGGDDDDGEAAADARSRSVEPQAVTDTEWLDDARQRLVFAQTGAEVEALVSEARKVFREHRLTRDDAAAFKAETDARLAELQVPA